MTSNVSLWQFINNNSAGIQAVSVVLTILVTAALAIITWKYVLLTKRLVNISESNLTFLQKLEQSKLKQEIVYDSLKFVLRFKDAFDHLRTLKFTYLNMKNIHPEQKAEIQKLNEDFLKEVYKFTDNKFFPELMFVSFQLKRLEKIELWETLEQLGNICQEMLPLLVECQNQADYEQKEMHFMKNMKTFIDECLEITKLKD